MPVKAVILDRDGTTYDPATRQLVAGASQAIERLEGLGVKVFVASGQGHNSTIEGLYSLPRDRFVVGMKSKKIIGTAVMNAVNGSPADVIYFGDGEQDMREAVNCRLAYFHAEYSLPGYKYGLKMHAPGEFVDHVERYFLKEHPWYLTVDANDKYGHSVTYRSLLNADAAAETGARDVVKGWSNDFTPRGGHYSVGYQVILHLISSFYLEGFHTDRTPNRSPVWCLYPGHTGEYGSLMQLFEESTARLLCAKFDKALLLRHKPCKSSKEQKLQRISPLISDQFNTVKVNESSVNSIKGNVVVVADDFSTKSHAMETARNLLYAAGAAKVIGLSVGKYGGANFTVFTTPRQNALRVGARYDLTESDFEQSHLTGQSNDEVLELFRKNARN